MTTPGFNFNFPFDFEQIRRDVFGRDPSLAFLGRAQQAGGGRGMQDFFRNRTGDFLRRYQAHLSRQFLEADPQNFDPNRDLSRSEDFFGGLNFQNEYLSQTPEERGFFPSRFAPKTRFLYR